MTIDDLLARLQQSKMAYRATLHEVQDQAPTLFRELRHRHGLTQRQLADILNCDFTFISKIENGHMRPGLPVLERLTLWLQENRDK